MRGAFLDNLDAGQTMVRPPTGSHQQGMLGFLGYHVGEMQPTLGPFLCRVAASLQTARTKQERSTYSKVVQEGEHFSRHL